MPQYKHLLSVCRKLEYAFRFRAVNDLFFLQQQQNNKKRRDKKKPAKELTRKIEEANIGKLKNSRNVAGKKDEGAWKDVDRIDGKEGSQWLLPVVVDGIKRH